MNDKEAQVAKLYARIEENNKEIIKLRNENGTLWKKIRIIRGEV